ncbi:DUF6678 family protein [Persicobacter psychrovividus]|uniref:Uncharacterized protein n=1 Tax=Persicobacter psychrovividus TaxID=387638 RepID=A0ABN6LIN4_9BACT|nr:hypothetical protein PEPS_37070 [Persicobacter psychrovividus]BDD01484.1 hypothetical protein PEPS_37640 [Persicobacter psychrovividus]
MKIRKDTPVRLKTFLGTNISPEDVDKFDDYWKLIGQSGTVINDKLSDKERVLVLFDRDLDDFQLANHNPIKNSLIIKKSDLELDGFGIYQQKLDKELLKRTSYMNNTKWFKIFNQLKKDKLFFSVAQVKFLISDTATGFSFDKFDSDHFDNSGFGDIGGGPFNFNEIEWISIPRKPEFERRNRDEKLNPKIISQPIDELVKAINMLGHFEYDLDEFELKIYGYK